MTGTAVQADPAAQPVPQSRMEPRTVKWLITLLGCTALMSFYVLGGGAGFEPTDCWVAQTAREMLQGEHPRDLIVPVFSGETRMQKSPGPYWAVMLIAAIRGQSDVDVVSTRIPSALAAIVLVATIFWLTRHIAGDLAALFAGFAASSSVLILWWSHRGASDLGLTACTTLALAAIWIAAERARPGAQRNALFLLGYFAAGLGMLYKLPMPLAVVGVPAVLYVLILRRWSILAHWVHLVGLALFLLPWLPWALAAAHYENTAIQKWLVEFVDRYTGDLPNYQADSPLATGDNGGGRGPLYYLPMPLAFCLPWTLSLPGAIARVFRRDGFAPALAPDQNAGDAERIGRRGRIFLLLWFAGLFLFFSASSGKEWRYLLPALPPLFALLGIELAAFFRPRPADRITLTGAIGAWSGLPVTESISIASGVRKWWQQRRELNREDLAKLRATALDYLTAAVLRRVALAGALAVWIGFPLAASIGLTIGLRKWWQQRGQFELEGLATLRGVATEVAIAAALLYVALAIAAWLYCWGRKNASFGMIVGGMFVFWLWVWPVVMPRFLSQRPFRDFAAQVVEHVPADLRPALRMIGTHDPRINWYGDLRFPRLIDQLALLDEQRERQQQGEQTGRRDLEYEVRRYVEEILAGLRGDQPVLYVFPLTSTYLPFITQVPPKLAERGEDMPPHHLWLQSRYGNLDRQMVLISNRPPPFDEPRLRLPDKIDTALRSRGAVFPVASQHPEPSSEEPGSSTPLPPREGLGDGYSAAVRNAPSTAPPVPTFPRSHVPTLPTPLPLREGQGEGRTTTDPSSPISAAASPVRTFARSHVPTPPTPP